MYAVHTGGASCPAAARSHGPAAPEKAAETLFHPKKCIFRGAAAGVTRSAGRCRARPPRAPFPGRVPALPGQGEPGAAGEGGLRGSPPPPRRGAPAARSPGSASAQTTQRNLDFFFFVKMFI